MLDFIVTLIIASIIMATLMCVTVAVTMPFHGALVRLRANYNPRAVGLEGIENRVGPTLTSLIGTLQRTKRLEGWYGLYKGTFPMLAFMTIISICSIIFVGGSSTKGPRGTYTVPEAGGFSMALFTVILTLFTLPATVIVNRCIITPYRLPRSPRAALRILLSPSELEKPYQLYLTPGLLAVTFTHAFFVTIIARGMRHLIMGEPDAGDAWNSVSAFRFIAFAIYQAIATGWLTPLEVVATRLSVQPNTAAGDQYSAVGSGEEMPEGVEYCGSGEDVIGLRPTTEPYEGALDCARKVIEEEGASSLYRGWLWTGLGNVFAVMG